jgi:DNA-binding PadR family transcriptional regulator
LGNTGKTPLQLLKGVEVRSEVGYLYICIEWWRWALGELERSVLVAIIHLQAQGYAVSIADEASRRLKKPVSLGAIYGTTDRLEKKGFISSRLGEPTPERGGKPKRLYRIEAPGERALSEVLERHNRIWTDISPQGEPA